MKEYLVSWHIDILATSPREAAEEALRIQRDVFSTATVFNVTTENATDFETIDLEEVMDK